MTNREYVGGAVIGEWVTTEPEYRAFQVIGRVIPETFMVRAGSCDFIPRHFDDWMRERTDAAHAAYMARHSAGGRAYA